MSIKGIKNKYAVLSWSSGMDSTSLLLHLLANGYKVKTISFDYGQKHKIELYRVRVLYEYLDQNKLNISHTFFNLKSLKDIVTSNLMLGGDDVPEGFYAEDNMKQTVVPNRNKIFSSIIQASALSIQNRCNPQDEVVIAMGIHSGDHSIYPDTTPEFREADLKSFHVGNWEADKIKYYTPYLYGDKHSILQDGLESCKKLGLDFDKVYSLTWTSYKPIFSKKHRRFFPDYKSGSSVERILAFNQLGIPDPSTYADESGKKVEWEEVVKHALKVEEEYKKKNPTT